MKEKTAAEPKHQFELLKSPIVAEFLGFRTEDSFAESDLESAILSHIRDFLMVRVVIQNFLKKPVISTVFKADE